MWMNLEKIGRRVFDVAAKQVFFFTLSSLAKALPIALVVSVLLLVVLLSR